LLSSNDSTSEVASVSISVLALSPALDPAVDALSVADSGSTPRAVSCSQSTDYAFSDAARAVAVPVVLAVTVDRTADDVMDRAVNSHAMALPVEVAVVESVHSVTFAPNTESAAVGAVTAVADGGAVAVF